jgi:hypothetical protein
MCGLAFQLPDKFEMAVDEKTAKALGLACLRAAQGDLAGGPGYGRARLRLNIDGGFPWN